MNLGDLIQGVERRSGVQFDRDAIAEAVNEALFTVAAERDWAWLDDTWEFTTIAGTAAYESAATWRKVETVTVAGAVVPMLPISQIDDDDLAVGWAVRGSELILSPTPGSVVDVKVRGVRNEARLVDDTDEPLMPDHWQQPVLVNLAASIVLERVGDLDRAERCLGRYRDGLRRMVGQAAAVKGPYRVRVRRGSML